MTAFSIRLRGLTLNLKQRAKLEQDAEAHCLNALERFDHLVRGIEVRLDDVNGPKGGLDKRCTIELRLRPRGVLIARSHDRDPFEAVKQASEVARESLVRRAGKRRAARAIRKKTIDLESYSGEMSATN